MSAKIEGKSCVRCKSYLFSEDDVVYCPVCGAPHHRDCYNAIGHCALEEFHGTENEYSPEIQEVSTEKAKTENKTELKHCRVCGEEYDINLNSCPKCTTPDAFKVNNFMNFDLLGGVPADYKLSENVTANEAKDFVMANPHRYIPKFALLNKKNKLSWNWLAFLFPCGWSLSRKMFKSGIIYGIFNVITSLLSYPLSQSLFNFGIAESTTYADMANILYENLPNIAASVLILAIIGTIIDLIVRVFAGMFSDYNYKGFVISKIQQIKKESDDISFDIRTRGGVNIFWFFVGTLVIRYIPAIILMLL